MVRGESVTGNMEQLQKWMASYLVAKDVAVAGAAADYFAEQEDETAEALFRCRIKPIRIGRRWFDWRQNKHNYDVACMPQNKYRGQIDDQYILRNKTLADMYTLVSQWLAEDEIKKRRKARLNNAIAEWKNPYRKGQYLVTSWDYPRIIRFAMIRRVMPKTLVFLHCEHSLVSGKPKPMAIATSPKRSAKIKFYLDADGNLQHTIHCDYGWEWKSYEKSH